MVQRADTYILKRHLPMYVEQGYKVTRIDKCPILRRGAGRARHEVVKATWEPIREPAKNVPREMVQDFEVNKAVIKPLKLARDNGARQDQDKSNIDKQGYWRDDEGSSYARWLSHQTMQAIATVDRSKFWFNAPRMNKTSGAPQSRT